MYTLWGLLVPKSDYIIVLNCVNVVTVLYLRRGYVTPGPVPNVVQDMCGYIQLYTSTETHPTTDLTLTQTLTLTRTPTL